MLVPRIYAIADAHRWAPQPLPEVVARLAAAGWPWIQIRDKHSRDQRSHNRGASDRDLLRLAEECVAAAGESARIWINDRADIAAMVGAFGVHVGDADPPPGALRQAFPGLKIGRTTCDAEGVAAADHDAAVDIVAYGPVFATATKADAPGARGVEGLERVRDSTDKPIIAIGGIAEHAIPDLRWAGADIIAVAGALVDRPGLVDEWVSRYAEARNTAWPRVFLTGFMAAGKSCVGRRLAAVLGWQFVDLDRLVTQEAEKTVHEIFASHGEAGFRARESAALRRALGFDRAVIACGGGVLESNDNCRILRDDAGAVVWLDASLEEIGRRLGTAAGRSRPLVDGDLRQLFQGRRQEYAETADVVVPVSDPEPISRTTRRVYDRLALADHIPGDQRRSR